MRRLLRVAADWAAGPRGTRVACIVGALVLLGVLLVVIVFVPQLAIDSDGLSRADWLKSVQDLRTSVLQGLGGLAVLAGAVVAALNLRETGRQNRAVQDQNREVLELQRRGQTTERFSKAIEQLAQQGDEKLDVRIGAVYALEQIARDSAELHWPIMEVLTAYLREHAPARAPTDSENDPDRERLPADHQAIATVIGRRRRLQDPDGERLDLRGTNLPGVRWIAAHLEQMQLDGAHLERGELNSAHLEQASLRGAHLERATLQLAHLDGAELAEAHLEGAVLSGAHLEGAVLSRAHLSGAGLVGTHLKRASLHGTHLEWASLHAAHLGEAELFHAHLEGADLRRTRGLLPEQLRSAANPELARLSPEQSAWLIVEPPLAQESEGRSEAES